MRHDSEGNSELLRLAARGDQQAWGSLLDHWAKPLERMVELRLDPRLRPRINPSDVLQETFLIATKRRDEYLGEDAPMPFRLWLRFLAGERLAALHRFHLGAQKRDAGRDQLLYSGTYNPPSSPALAAQLAADCSSPSQQVVQAELRLQLKHALEQMEPLDQELLALRHFEQMTNREAAEVLGMNASTTSSRYLRALRQLRKLLGDA